MSETPTSTSDIKRAVREAKKQASEVSDAAQDLYGQAVDGASRTAGSFERALRKTVENQPYTAVAIALELGGYAAECTGRFEAALSWRRTHR